MEDGGSTALGSRGPVQRLRLLRGQLPAQRASVLRRLGRILRAGDGDHALLAYEPLERHLPRRLAMDLGDAPLKDC